MFAPFILVFLLGIIGIYLTYSGYLPGRTYLGWLVVGATFAVLLGTAIWSLKTSGDMGSFGMILALSFASLIQLPLIAELIARASLPDPSRGLKVLRVHTEPEKMVAEENLPGAIKEYEKIIEKDPKDLEARFRLAELCAENKEYKRSVNAYEALLPTMKKQATDKYCIILTRLSELYSRHLGEPEKARQHLQTIITQNPDTKYAEYAQENLTNL